MLVGHWQILVDHWNKNDVLVDVSAPSHTRWTGIHVSNFISDSHSTICRNTKHGTTVLFLINPSRSITGTFEVLAKCLKRRSSQPETSGLRNATVFRVCSLRTQPVGARELDSQVWCWRPYAITWTNKANVFLGKHQKLSLLLVGLGSWSTWNALYHRS